MVGCFSAISPNEKVYAVCGGIWKNTDDKPTQFNDAQS